MKLSECAHGKLVVRETKEYIHSQLITKSVVVGMVVGVGQNCMDEAVPLIQWQDGKSYPTHHENLSLYKD